MKDKVKTYTQRTVGATASTLFGAVRSAFNLGRGVARAAVDVATGIAEGTVEGVRQALRESEGQPKPPTPIYPKP